MDALNSPLVLGLVVPLLILLLVAAAFLLVRYWRQRIPGELKNVRGRLRALETRLRSLSTQAGAYSPEDPEPFGQAAGQLANQVEQAAQLLASAERQYATVQQSVQTGLRSGWQVAPQAPFVWLRLRLAVRDLDALVTRAETEIASAESALRALHRRGWETAEAAREVQKDLGEIQHTLQKLRSWKLQGVPFEEASRQKSMLQLALSEIPEAFFNAEEAALNEQTDKPAIVQTHALLAEKRQPVKTLHAQLKTWQSQYQAAAGGLAELRNTLSQAREKLAAHPPELDLGAQNARLEQINREAQLFEQQVASPEVDRLPALAREARRGTRLAQDLMREIDQAVGAWQTRQGRIQALRGGYDTLNTRLADLVRAEPLPIDWDLSFGALTEARHELDRLAAESEPRAPEQVQQDLAALDSLETRRADLDQLSQAAAARRQDLLVLLERVRLDQMIPWVKETAALAEQAAGYGRENWPRQASVETLAAQAGPLAEQAEALDRQLKGRPVRETEMEALAASLRAVESDLRGLQGQEKAVRRRFAELQALEAEALEKLNELRAVLAHLGRLSRANELLEQQAAPALERYQQEAAGLVVALEDKANGAVHKQANQVNTLLRQVEQSANAWLQALNQDLAAREDRLADALGELRAVADLAEPVVEEAQKTLGAQQRDANRRGLLPLAELPLRLKQRNEAWQRLVGLEAAVAELRAPVMEAAEMANAQRIAARAELNQARALISDPPSWPPTNQTLTAELSDFQAVERQWDRLQETPTRAIAVVQQLGELARRYMGVAEKARKVAERAQAEQLRARELEHQLNESIQLWRAQMRANANNPLTRQEIQQLLHGAQSAVSQIKQNYQQGGLTYAQAEQELILLLRRVNNAQVSLDERTLIDINGETRLTSPTDYRTTP